MDFVGGTTDKFGSLPEIVVDSRKLGLAHPVGPHDPGAEPLRMVDQDMKRRPLDRNARALKPDTQFSEDIVNEALIARVVCQPVHDVAVRMRGDWIDFWRRVHILLLSSDLDRRYEICRVPARRRQWSRPQSACAHHDAGRRDHGAALDLYRTLDCVQNRRSSRSGSLQRAADRHIIAPQRSNSAHLHRLWHASSECAIAGKCRRSILAQVLVLWRPSTG